MPLKWSGKLLLQNFSRNEEDAIFAQAGMGLLGCSSQNCVNQNYRKKEMGELC